MRTTLSVSIEEALDSEVRAEAERQRRPLSWVVEEALRKGLPKHASNGADASTGATPVRRTRS